MSHHNIVFPLKIARGAIGGPIRRTDVQTKANGMEARNAAFAHSLRRWEIATKGSSLDDLSILLAFFEARLGRVHSFLFKDYIDYKSCLPSNNISAIDQNIGTADGVKKDFPLVKNYGDNFNNYSRPIKAVESLLVAINGNQTTQYSFNNGIISFANAPQNGAIISAGFEFYNIVRFGNDSLELMQDSETTGRANSIELFEVRDA